MLMCCHRLRLFDGRWRGKIGTGREGTGAKCVIRSFMVFMYCTLVR